MDLSALLLAREFKEYVFRLFFSIVYVCVISHVLFCFIALHYRCLPLIYDVYLGFYKLKVVAIVYSFML